MKKTIIAAAILASTGASAGFNGGGNVAVTIPGNGWYQIETKWTPQQPNQIVCTSGSGRTCFLVEGVEYKVLWNGTTEIITAGDWNPGQQQSTSAKCPVDFKAHLDEAKAREVKWWNTLWKVSGWMQTADPLENYHGDTRTQCVWEWDWSDLETGAIITDNARFGVVDGYAYAEQSVELGVSAVKIWDIEHQTENQKVWVGYGNPVEQACLKAVREVCPEWQ